MSFVGLPAGFSASAPTVPAGFGSNRDPYEEFFSRFQPENAIHLPNGYTARRIWSVSRESQATSPDAIALANKGAHSWTPKGSQEVFPQRCPFVSVDNVCFLFDHTVMKEPEIVLGLFSKPNVSVHGTVVPLYEGLVLAAGGHAERMKPVEPIKHYQKWKYELGDMSLRDAADKELKEEIGIDPHSKIVTRPLAIVDDPIGEPRAHYIRAIFLRWIVQRPKPSAELKTVITMPISAIPALCKGEISYTTPNGKKLGLILKHDVLLQTIMALPDTQSFLTNIVTFHESAAAAAAGVHHQPPFAVGSGGWNLGLPSVGAAAGSVTSL